VRVDGLLRNCALGLLVALLTACGGAAGTPPPAGYPLNACPVIGDGGIVPQEGYQLVVPGQIVFGWAVRHNETPSTLACGAQSVQGAKLTIRRSELGTDPKVDWVATLRRAVPLVAPEAAPPRLQLFKVDDAGPSLIETTPLTLAEQYAAIGAILPGAPLGRYRMTIISQTNEVLAEGSFTIVE
jgi:hypothetical protein